MDAALIVGCGYVGSRLASDLCAAGISPVIGMRRHVAALPIGVQAFAADLNEPFALDFLKPYANRLQVIFAASAGEHSPAAYEKIYLAGMARLLAACKRHEITPRRFHFISSTSVYGDSHGDVVTEATPARPDGFAGEIMLAAEAQVRASGFAYVIERFGGIYGPGRWRLIEQVKRGEAFLLPQGGPMTNRIHRDDGARAIAHLMALRQPDELYLIVDDEPVPQNEITLWIAEQCQKIVSQSSLASPTSRQLRGNKRCSNALLKASGFRCLYPSFREGYSTYFAAQVANERIHG